MNARLFGRKELVHILSLLRLMQNRKGSQENEQRMLKNGCFSFKFDKLYRKHFNGYHVLFISSL